MQKPIAAAIVLVAGLIFNAGAFAQAATPAKPAAKPAAKAAKPAAKSKPAPKAAAEAPLAKADAEQMTAASMAHIGAYACEMQQSVQLDASTKHEGYVDLHFKNQSWTMKPVLSSTGALRLEDVKGRMLMLQIANKSMLMDTQLGQRVVDECIHPKHLRS